MTTPAGAGDRVESSDTLHAAIRAGLVAYGVVHLLIGYLALQLALGDSSGKASSNGALHQVAQQSFGRILIWLIAVGMLLLVGWRLLEAWRGHDDEEGAALLRKRTGSVAKAVLYGAIAVSAVRVAIGSSSGGGTDSTTARLMDLPAGRWIVALVGVAVLGYGANQVRTAWTERFREHLTGEGTSGGSGTAYVWFGKAGYAAKGLAVGVVGGLFVHAALTHEAKKSGGLDVALHKVLQQPFGPFLLGVIAAGIASYGLFCFARARHLSR